MTRSSHPALQAFRLTGGKSQEVADACAVSLETVGHWQRGAEIPARHLKIVRRLSYRQLAIELRFIGPKLAENPRLALNAAFRAYLNDLNLATWLAYGHTILDAVQQLDGENHEHA